MKIQLAIVDPSAPWGQPLFVDGSGRPVYLGRGADGSDDGGEGEGDSGADADEDGDDDGGDDSKKGDGKKPGEEADAEALRRRMKAADKRANDAEARLRALEDAGKDKLEVAERKVTELTEANKKLTESLREQSLVNAFLLVNEHEWQDNEDALDLARRKGYLDDVQDADGEVDQKALKAKLAAFAKAKPHMLKTKKAEDGDEGKKPAGTPATGTPTGSGRKKGTEGSPTEAELRARYGALRR